MTIKKKNIKIREWGQELAQEACSSPKSPTATYNPKASISLASHLALLIDVYKEKKRAVASKRGKEL